MNDQSAERLTDAIHSLIEAMGMQAENENRKHRGESIAYTDEAFRAIRFGGAKYLPMSPTPTPSPTVEELPSDEEIVILSPYPMEVQGRVDWMNGATRMRERAAPIISRLKGDLAEAKTAYRTATEMLEEERKVCDRNINQTITTKRELAKLRDELSAYVASDRIKQGNLELKDKEIGKYGGVRFVDVLWWYQHDPTTSTTLSVSEVVAGFLNSQKSQPPAYLRKIMD